MSCSQDDIILLFHTEDCLTDIVSVITGAEIVTIIAVMIETKVVTGNAVERTVTDSDSELIMLVELIKLLGVVTDSAGRTDNASRSCN